MSHTPAEGTSHVTRCAQCAHRPVRVLFVDAVEELQQAAAHVTGDGSHHAKVIIDQSAAVLCVHCNVARMGICTHHFASALA